MIDLVLFYVLRYSSDSRTVTFLQQFIQRTVTCCLFDAVYLPDHCHSTNILAIRKCDHVLTFFPYSWPDGHKKSTLYICIFFTDFPQNLCDISVYAD